MSIFPTVPITDAIARLRQHLDHPHLPSKRKLEDYGPLESEDEGDNRSSPATADVVRMRKPVPPSAVAPFISSFSSSIGKNDSRFPASSPSTSFSPPTTLHFFVRTMSKTLVIHANPNDTVDSVIDQIQSVTGIAAWEQRLIYCGRQLQGHSTLADSSIKTDACVHLTGRLRSTKFPRAWQLVNDLVSSVCCLTSGNNSNKSMISNIDGLLKEFLTMTPTSGSIGEGDDTTIGHLQVFILASAPAALTKLYLSPVPGNQVLAEKAIRLFLNPNADCLPKYIQVQCAPIVLEFCKLLAGTAGKNEPLYLSCRSTLGSLLEAQGSKYSGNVKNMNTNANLISELFPFVSEMAATLMAGLSTESMFVSLSDLAEFSNFLLALRRAINDWMGGTGPIPMSLYSGAHPRYEDWIGSLHAIFMDLLRKTDGCLMNVEEVMTKGPMNEARWALWSHFLNVLTELNSFSKIYDGAVELFHAVLRARQAPVNALIRRAKRSDNLRWLLKRKDVIDFEARRNLVLMMFPEGKDDYDEMHEMLIDRSQLLAESFEYIAQAEARSLHGGLFMEFKNEEATGPGVLREWFCLLCRAIFNPQNPLFLRCPNDHRRFFPNPASVVDPLHLKYFGFCGRVIALALMHKVQVGIVFDRVFFLQLAGKAITLEDVQGADPCLYMSCKQILEMDAEILDSDALGLTFIREIEELGTQRAVELCPGGKDIVVNSKNREEYVRLLIQHCFGISISVQVSHFAQGFSDILSNSKLQKFFFQSLDLEDFDRMLGGSDNIINVRDWKAHTEYHGYKAKDRQICWFWKIVEGMPEEQQRVLLFFWTSVKYLPVDGFGGLSSKLYIYKALDSNDHLPTSHTCFFRLCLPPYQSIAMMRDRLQLITHEHVSCSFGIW